MALASRFAVPVLESNVPNGHYDVTHTRAPSELTLASMPAADYEFPVKSKPSSQEPSREMASLTARETLEVFDLAVDNARQGILSLAGNTRAAEVAKPKLTLDLKNCTLDKLPSEVVDIIRPDVERLQLAHNKLRDIPFEFTNCLNLKYLNLRDNRFDWIPKAVFGLPQLEILDFSRNNISEVPEEIDKMRALRVFAIQHNRIGNLPLGLGSISTLRMLKVTGNPLNPELKRVVDPGEDTMSPTTPAQTLPNDENERDKLLTRKIIDYLRTQAAIRDSGEDDSSDGPLETPRAQSRFPVQPSKYGHSTSGSESASELRSPAFMKPPSSASRSHFRVPSFSNNNLQASTSAARRPGLAPLALGSERNRSNSESVIQANQVTKNKRMGMITKKQPDLGVLDENRAHRNSHHFRGQSHGSALRNSIRPDQDSPPDVISPKSHREGTFVRRLSSVPEQKQDSISTDKIIEGAKGVLYSLHLVHPQMSTLMTVVRDPKAKRSSLERVYHNASMHLDYLDQQLHRFDNTQRRGKKHEKVSKKTICRAAHACVVAYQQVGSILLYNIKQLVRDGDQRYIRTLMLMLYGSLNEARNARRSLFATDNIRKPSQTSIPVVPALQRLFTEDIPSDRADAITPTQERPIPPEKEKRWRNGSINQQTMSYNNLAALGSGAQTAVPTHMNSRSRSNSRAAGFYSSTASSVASTPRSGESFSSNLLVPRSRSGSVARSPERAYQMQVERDQFERIFLNLNKTVDQGIEAIYYLGPHFVSNVERSEQGYTPPRVKQLAADLLFRTRQCGELSETLRIGLSRIKLNDPDARNAPDFWRLVKKFVNAWGNFLVVAKEARVHQLINDDMRRMLNPVHRLTVDTARLLADSPWRSATDDREQNQTPSAPPSTIHSRAPTPVQQNGHPPAVNMGPLQPPPPTPMAMQPPSRSQSQSRGGDYYHRRPAGNKGSNESNNVTSPQSFTPATPLSAALGPAAQATVPSTPGGGGGGPGLDRSFHGDVFQRADYLAQTMRRIV